MYSWGQDTVSFDASFRAVRWYYSARYWHYINASRSYPDVGFRPVLEVLNPGTLGSDGLKAVTLDLGGGKLGNSSEDIQIIVKNGKSFTAPASEGLTRPDGSRPLLIAVTQLTSTSEERMRGELLIDAPIDEVIVRYARNAREAGLDGVVCSPLEAGMVKQACGAEFLTVTPGVRFADGDMGDQVRVTTPARAREIGSDFIVVGRPVTAASDPVAAYRRCVAEFVGAE